MLTNSNKYNRFEFKPLRKTELELVYIVDDEPDILELLAVNLHRAGYNTQCFEDANSFFSAISEKTPNLVILDLMLPDADGIEICKYLKKDDRLSNIPVIMLTAKADEMDKVIGLEIGADDYITKPFSIRELTARVKVVLKRYSRDSDNDEVEIDGIIKINHKKYEVYVNDTKVNLTSTEYKILTMLSKRKGWVYSREQILEKLGASEKGVIDRTVDVHIKNLREKLGEAGKYIKNIRAVGYKLDVEGQ